MTSTTKKSSPLRTPTAGWSGEGQGRIPNRILRALLLPCLLLTGCSSKELPVKPLHGTVTCGNEKVPTGQVVFMPIEGTPGTNATAMIVDGQYHVTSHGGVALGKHRVIVNARKKTGRKVQGHNGREAIMIDEEVRMGPAAYDSNQSPLVVEITADFDGQYDIVIPGSR